MIKKKKKMGKALVEKIIRRHVDKDAA